MEVYIVIHDYLDKDGDWNTEILEVFDNEEAAVSYREAKEKRLKEKILNCSIIGDHIREEGLYTHSYDVIRRPVLHKEGP